MLHAGVVEMLVKEHFQLAVGRIAASAGIVPRHQNRRAQLVQRRDAVCFSRRRFWNPESSELPSGIQTHPPREGRYAPFSEISSKIFAPS